MVLNHLITQLSMKIYFIIFCCFQTIFCWSQIPSFEYQNLSPEQQQPTFALEDNFGNFIIAADLGQGCKFVKLNSQGEFIISNIQQRDNYETTVYHMFQEENNFFAMGTQSYIKADSTLLWVLKLDENLNVVDEKHQLLGLYRDGIPFQCNNQYADTLICVGTGSYNGNLPTATYGIKYLGFDEIIIHDIDLGFNALINDLVISSEIPNRYFINGWDMHVTDAEFNHIESFSNVHYGQVGDLQPHTDSTYLLASKYFWSGHKNIQIGSFDFNGNEINSFLMGHLDSVSYTTFSKSIDSHDSNIYMGGTTRIIESFPINLQTGISNFILGKFNMDLDSIWVHTYGVDGYHFLNFVIATQDGGCLMVGTKHDYINNPTINQLYTLKVDGNGNVINSTTIPMLDSQLSIFPNPASDKISIQLSDNLLQFSALKFILNDVTGRKIMETYLNNTNTGLNIQHLPASCYFGILKTTDGVILKQEKIIIAN